MEKSKIKVCCGNKCSERGSMRILEEVEEHFGVDSVEMVECMKYCELAPNVECKGKMYHESSTKTIVERLKKEDGREQKELSYEDLDLDNLI